jgi:hypothetical protein
MLAMLVCEGQCVARRSFALLGLYKYFLVHLLRPVTGSG